MPPLGIDPEGSITGFSVSVDMIVRVWWYRRNFRSMARVHTCRRMHSSFTNSHRTYLRRHLLPISWKSHQLSVPQIQLFSASSITHSHFRRLRCWPGRNLLPLLTEPLEPCPIAASEKCLRLQKRHGAVEYVGFDAETLCRNGHTLVRTSVLYSR